jgi:16S rRNA (guanine1207-N2)-methyltransferase
VNPDPLFGVFGAPDPALAAPPSHPVQLSPQVPGARALEEAAPDSFTGMVMAAPPGTLERRHALALGLRALAPGAPLTAMAPKDKGGNRIAQELEAFGCDVLATSRRHQRICQTMRPGAFAAPAQAAIDAAIAEGDPCFDAGMGLWTQPGVFSWNRIDPGTALLLSALPAFAGRGADLGCGLGVIARAVLAGVGVTHMDLVDLDRRALAAARRNVTDPRAAFHWADVRRMTELGTLDFTVMNPPFHDGGQEDKALGLAFIRQAHRMLRTGGTACLVANRHLPYESLLAGDFSAVALRAEGNGFKVYEARK